MANAERMQRVLRTSRESGSTAWDSLKRVYNKVMGNPMLPAHFGQEQSLPPHLQDVLERSGYSYADALRKNLGDLERELLRATFDKDYYREPLMGYKSYDNFLRKHGEQASYEKLQELSPADRLLYMMNFGQQSKSEKAAAHSLERDLRDLQSRNPQLAELQAAREKARQQTEAAKIIYDELLAREIAEIMGNTDLDEDIPHTTSGGHTGGNAGGESGNRPASGDSPNSGAGNANTSHNETPAQHGNTNTPAPPPATPSAQHQGALDAVTRHQIIWEATRKANPDLFSRLSTAYDRVIGNVTLPATFKDPASLPQHLQSLINEKGGFEGAMRADIGDLDRELLRATFDASYYQEPLMGYASYAKFMARHGDQATAAQIQKLSPPDRLQYLANHGQQSRDEVAALQQRMRDDQRLQQNNAQHELLEELRSEMRKQEAINAAIFEQMADKAIRDANKALIDDDDL